MPKKVLFDLGRFPLDGSRLRTTGISIWGIPGGSRPPMLVLMLTSVRYQRAYMDYFSMRHGQMKGNARALALDQLLAEPKPLVYGLFGDFGQAFLVLSDGIEMQNPLLIVESLVLAAADWSNTVYDLLTHPQLIQPPEVCLSPEVILRRIAYDGRFSGLMRSGPGFHSVSLVFSNSAARMALIDYVHLLDIEKAPDVIDQLAQLAVQLLCAAHKKERPAFDFYLSFPLSFVQGLRILLQSSDNALYGSVLIRGVWLLILLVYITQLRPCLDDSLISGSLISDGQATWDTVFSDFRSQGDSFNGISMDTHYLRALRSLFEVAKWSPENDYFLRAAWKLKSQWRGWTGFGSPKEESLNIRL